MIEYHDYYVGVITDDNGEVVRYVTLTENLLDALLLNFPKLCGKPGYYTFRVDGDSLYELPIEYDFWIKQEGNGLREIPLSVF